MRIRRYLRYVVVGLLIGLTIVPGYRVQAQWEVADHMNWATNVKKYAEDALHWIDTVNHYASMVEKTTQQVVTLGGILTTVDKLVATNKTWVATMSDIGQTVRDVFLIKNNLEALVKTRLSSIKAIDSRLKSGLFDPEADMRDFETYLRDGIGRSSQDTVANMERLASMDNQLERLRMELLNVSARKAAVMKQEEVAQINLQAELAKSDDTRCASCISDLKLEIVTLETQINQLNSAIDALRTQIEERAKKYNVKLRADAEFGGQVTAVNDAWVSLEVGKDNLADVMDKVFGSSPDSN